LECFLERTFCDGAQFSYRIFLNLSSLLPIRRTACARAQFSGCSSTTNAHSETGQMEVCCQNLTLGALSSRSALSVLVGALFKMLSPVADLALLFLSKFYHKRHDIRGKKLLNMKCVFLIFSTTTFFCTISFLEEFWQILQMHIGLHDKRPLFLSDFINET
jgi:hypothetical protein